MHSRVGCLGLTGRLLVGLFAVPSAALRLRLELTSRLLVGLVDVLWVTLLLRSCAHNAVLSAMHVEAHPAAHGEAELSEASTTDKAEDKVDIFPIRAGSSLRSGVDFG